MDHRQNNDQDNSEKRNRMKWFPIMIGIAIVLSAVLITGIYNAPVNRLRRQLDLGNKYLEEQQYEQAAVAFRAIIEIDPKCEEAYRGLADAYLAMEDYESAMDILQQGINQTGSEELAAYLEEIKETYARIQEEAAAREREEAEAIAEAEKAREQEELLNRVAIRTINRRFGSETIEAAEVFEENAEGETINVISYSNYPDRVIREEDEMSGAGGAVSKEDYEYYDCEYDAEDRIVKEYCYDGYMANIYEYDSEGRMVKASYASELNGPIEGYTTYEYDADGRLLREASMDSEGDVISESQKEYDAQGRLVRKSSYYGGEIADEETYFWECENDSGEFQTIYLQEYEYLTEWGSMERKLVRETFYDKEGEIIKENLYET